MRKFWIIVLIIVVVVVARQCFFTVGPTEFVYVTQFGKHIATYDGGNTEQDSGLHFHWPWPVQSVQRIDRRLQYFDLPATELPTQDAEAGDAAGKGAETRIDKMLIVEAYVCWRIADRDKVDQFIRTLGTPERAQDIFGQSIKNHLEAAISQMSTRDLINTDGQLVDAKMHQLWQGTLAALQEPLRSDYGVELVDVRVRRFYHSPQVTNDIYDAIRAKRKQKAQEYYSKGELEKSRITKNADVAALKIEADAEKYAEQKKKDAQTDALEIRNQAYKKDRELHEFVQKLEALRMTLKQNKTLLLLSTHRTFFEMLFQPPGPNGIPVSPPGVPAKTPDKSNGSKAAGGE